MTDWIIAITAINVFVFCLCAIIILCGKFLRQSGTVKLTSGDVEKDVECGQSLLSACMSSGMCLPAACGGKGTCGKCSVRVLNGGSAVTTLERIKLNSDDISNGIRLACQVRVRKNIELDASVAASAASVFKAKLVKAENVSDRIKILYFEYSEGRMERFMAGRYVQINYKLPWENVSRAYSVSSVSENGFTLDVQAVEGGLVSNYLHSVKIGSELEFSGAYGDMCLPVSLLASSVLLAAGGVGLAPLRAIVDDLVRRDYKGKILLFQGARSRSDLYNEKYFEELERTCENFKYFPALSEPKLQDGWSGFEGMVHELIDKEVIQSDDIECFICGPKPMMEATENILYKKGAVSDRIHKDEFY